MVVSVLCLKRLSIWRVQQKCKLLLLLLFGAGAIAFTWLTLSLPTPFFGTPLFPLAPISQGRAPLTT